MGRCKGTNLAHVHAFVTKEFGDAGLGALKAALRPQSQSALDSYVAMAWYPGDLYVELLHALEDTVGEGDATLLDRAGAYAAEYDLTRIHRVLFRLANPAYLLEKSMEIWGRFFDTGQWRITRPSATSAEGALHDFALFDRAVCAYLTGYLRHLFELVGAKNVEVKHTECRTRGAKACRFTIAWT